MKNQTILFDTITPHPGPVNIPGLLNDIEAVIKKHVILNPQAAVALAVWVLHTYVFELRDTVAYVAIESPEKRCGKTTLLSVLAAMAHKPLIASNITVGALFRAIDTCSPTLFIDEADTFLAGNSIMRGIINSGNTWRTAYVLRLSKSKHTTPLPLPEPIQSSNISRHQETIPPLPAGEGRGEGESPESPFAVPNFQHSTINHQLPESSDSGIKKYSCWCPKVIAMIGEVPDTIGDRSIVVKMARKLTTEACAPLAELESGVFSLAPIGGEGRGEEAPQGTTTSEIRSKCARFALDYGPSIAQCEKTRVEGLNDRAADTFDPLYAIARHAGEEWTQKLHTAAYALASSAQSQSSGAELLLDILSIFVQAQREKIFSRDLALMLREGSDGMRSFVLKQSDLNEFQISQILRPYGIKPSTMRIGKEVNKGYVGADFHEALIRYIPRAEAEVRVEEIKRRAQLQVEARDEEQKEAAMKEQMLDHMGQKPLRAAASARFRKSIPTDKNPFGDDDDDEDEA